MEWHSQTDRINKFDSEGLISSESDNICGAGQGSTGTEADTLKYFIWGILFGEQMLQIQQCWGRATTTEQGQGRILTLGGPYSIVRLFYY